MSRYCEECQGTGRFQARFGGPDWPICPACAGSGLNEHRPSIEDKRLQMLNTSLEIIKKQEELLKFIQDEFLIAISALSAATSSYKTYAGNSKSRGTRDALYSTRLADYEKATDQARTAYEEFQTRLSAIK